MNQAPVIELEDDPVPVVKVIGAQLKRALTEASHRKLADELAGYCFALSSTTDPQKVSVDVGRDKITIHRGIAAQARIIIHLDFNDSSKKPKIVGLLRHPLIAIKIGKLLEPPPQDWVAETKKYWQAVANYPRMPRAIRFISTTDPVELRLGDEQIEPEVTISGNAKTLLGLANGTSVFAEIAMAGKIQIETNVEHFATLTEVSIKRLLGEL